MGFFCSEGDSEILDPSTMHLQHLFCSFPRPKQITMNFSEIHAKNGLDFVKEVPLDVRVEAATLCQGLCYIYEFGEQFPDFFVIPHYILSNILEAFEFSKAEKCANECKWFKKLQYSTHHFGYNIYVETLDKIFKNILPRRIKVTYNSLFYRSDRNIMWHMRSDIDQLTVEDAISIALSGTTSYLNIEYLKKCFEEQFATFKKFMLWLYQASMSKEFDGYRENFHYRMNDSLQSSSNSYCGVNGYTDDQRKYDDFFLNEVLNGLLEGKYNYDYKGCISKVSKFRRRFRRILPQHEGQEVGEELGQEVGEEVGEDESDEYSQDKSLDRSNNASDNSFSDDQRDSGKDSSGFESEND